jgi:LmbE family N-acetylglucosaminyl deacetylase
MQFSQPQADVYVPGGAASPAEALASVTHLSVGAHQDDIEIMSYSGICDCLDTPGKAFGGVVVTNGAGSSRIGPYAAFTDTQMQDIRRDEQRKAADLGRYAIQIQLAHPSSAVKRPGDPGVAADLLAIFKGCRPEVVYLHQPADKHDTHIGVLARCLDALRSLPADQRPRRVLGCEVWRDLDWLVDTDKVALDSGRRPELALELLKVFDSQISGGKRYDLAAIGRRLANATYFDSHSPDKTSGITWALDLTPLMSPRALDLAGFVAAHVERLQTDISNRISRSV